MGYTKSEFENNQLQLNQENSKFSSFFISLTQNNEDIGSLSISNKQSGRYYFESENKNISTHVWIESTDGICRLFCEEPLCFVSMTNVIFNQLVLTDQCSLYIHSKEDPDFIVEVIVDLDDLKSESFNNYYILDSTEVTVGSLGNNDIQYTNAYISRNHVRIYKLNHDWYVEDLNSTNGTRLNRKRIKHEKMNIGDEVSLFGLRIIMGINFISINDSIPQLSMNKNKLIKINSVDDFELPAPEKSKNEQIYFNRSPRRRYPLNIPEIQFQSPPMTINNKQIPLVLRLGSSAVMGGDLP